MPDMPHLDDTPALERTIDLALAQSREKELRAAERVIVALLAELHGSARPIDPTVRRQAYVWLYEHASREEQRG
ncbi:MAG TPA: hypothetical protein VEC57_14915 [Candidatus Limnocylindrales bacterium]|nr:hypothetical protein [Candidatus Limnocylindrales bacterium]